ncbi:MAG TPA: glycolate oxidase subunit GlcE [Candidatus Tenderia electrophaga]|uniref:Glycolate oxidase subunit GlcE n=1 Tax=Candidatus Tenderia electrophaga TaxID=1748243 RepID=A0A832J344_9GAMM|nr:glycolate oxidase subunit GlcE [Candidatus Tenderia electrophaga]
MNSQSISELLQTQIQQAVSNGHSVNIVAGGSKYFLGRQGQGATLNISQHRGIIEYDPRELVITARAGTPLQEIEQTLADKQQMLPFEPPHFGPTATLGGTIATGLSGPRRPYVGSARDFVLGCKLLNSKGEIMQFGGRVMKNVAGYDVSRLMTGAYGTLGVMLELSLKVLPRPAATVTLIHECNEANAITFMSGLLSKALAPEIAALSGSQN